MITELQKQGRWKWLKTLKHNELAALELTDEERIAFNCPIKRVRCVITMVRTGATIVVDRVVGELDTNLILNR